MSLQQILELSCFLEKPNDRCYDLELFCTPYPQRGLTLFDPDDVSKGFYVRKYKKN